MRFLCLHGAGTNAQIFKMQLARLMYMVRHERHEFEFVEGDIPCEPAAGIKDTFSEQTCFFQYFDQTQPESIIQAVDQLHSLLAAEEPAFDGVIGFSQGAMLGATILMDHWGPDASRSPPLKCALLICSPLPLHVERMCQIERGHDMQDRIRVPTFHVYGTKDAYYQQSVELGRLCDAALRQEYDHGEGHEIPSKAAFADALAEGFRKCVMMANAMQ